MRNRKTAPIENKITDWKIMRRRGRKVRYQNVVTGQWDYWEDAPPPGMGNPAKQLRVLTAEHAESIHNQLLGMATIPTLSALAQARGMVTTSKTRKAELIEFLRVC